MANSIRVYELARELGMANAQLIDLCSSLGIGVKSHSSGMVEAQADRVRRKAERDGLVVAPEQVEEVVAPEQVEEVLEPVVEEVLELVGDRAAEGIGLGVFEFPRDCSSVFFWSISVSIQIS